MSIDTGTSTTFLSDDEVRAWDRHEAFRVAVGEHLDDGDVAQIRELLGKLAEEAGSIPEKISQSLRNIEAERQHIITLEARARHLAFILDDRKDRKHSR